MIQRTLTLVNPKGLHARASHRLVQCAGEFQCQVTIEFRGIQADGKQIMSVMLLAAPVGSELAVTCNGDDESACMEALEQLIATGLGELSESSHQ